MANSPALIYLWETLHKCTDYWTGDKRLEEFKTVLPLTVGLLSSAQWFSADQSHKRSWDKPWWWLFESSNTLIFKVGHKQYKITLRWPLTGRFNFETQAQKLMTMAHLCYLWVKKFKYIDLCTNLEHKTNLYLTVILSSTT